MQIVEWNQMATKLAKNIRTRAHLCLCVCIDCRPSKLYFCERHFTSIFHIRHFEFVWRQSGNWTSEKTNDQFISLAKCAHAT